MWKPSVFNDELEGLSSFEYLHFWIKKKFFSIVYSFYFDLFM